MKKLLAMVMAMTMLCASMGVLATGAVPTGNNTSLIWAWDFEEENVGLVGSDKLKTQREGGLWGAPADTNSAFWVIDSRNKASVVSNNEIEGVTAASGTHLLHLDTYTSKFLLNMSVPHLIPLEKDALYKFSFKYATSATAAAVVALDISEMEDITTKNWANDKISDSLESFYSSADANWGAWIGAPYPLGFCAKETYEECVACETDLGATKPEKCTNADCQAELAEDGTTVQKTRYTQMAWNNYEIYFKSKNVDVQHLMIHLGIGKNIESAFFDDLKLEKVNGSTDVIFSTNSPATSTYTTLSTKTTIVGRNVGTESDVNVMSYPFCTLRAPASEMNSTAVTVSVAHVPQKAEETIQLFVGQYATVDGQPKLLNLWNTPVTFTAATKTDATTQAVTEYYYAENTLQKSVLTLTGLESVTDSYLQAFVFDSTSGLRPVGGKAILPAAVAATPVE